MNKEELIVELECNDVQVNIDDTRITYCNSLDKELVKAIYNLQQQNKQLKEKLNEIQELLDNRQDYHCETCLLFAIQDVIDGEENDD